jgi:hydroxylamine reductase
MFCNQCEQTASGTGCVEFGVCGKDPDVHSLQEILLYGLKGLCAYKHHARRLGMVDPAVDAFVEEALFSTMTNVNFDLHSHVEMAMECGRQNLRVMELLDEGHTRRFGKPSPTTVYEGTSAGPGILVSGHDMLDLANLLEQTSGTGINVYTHGEMLPAHMYPELRKHTHLAGNYGGAWQKQRSEFTAFNGPILVTTNCVLTPDQRYADRLFTARATAVPGSTCIKNDDFSAIIAKARECPPLPERKVRESVVGFHHGAILGLAEHIVSAVKAGRISRFFLIGGCDGARPGRSYYAEYARNAPADALILTLGCGKFRIRDHDYGTIDLDGAGPLPRLLDMGQCNDAYGAIQVAVALSKAFDCSVNDLPLTIVLSWFEQKAVAVLLTLLALGVKGIRVGPTAPAFISPNVLRFLKDNFDLQLIEESALVDLRLAVAGSN